MDNIGQKVQGEWEKGEAAYRRVGRMLLDQKAALGHGKFEKWFRAQGFGFSLRQAQQYMKLARVSKTHSSAHLNDLHTGNQKLKKATAVKKAMAEPKQLTQKEQAVVQAKEIADLIDYLVCQTGQFSPQEFVDTCKLKEVSETLARLSDWLTQVKTIVGSSVKQPHLNLVG
jgi:hypothetical protein